MYTFKRNQIKSSIVTIYKILYHVYNITIVRLPKNIIKYTHTYFAVLSTIFYFRTSIAAIKNTYSFLFKCKLLNRHYLHE